jgi:hypothetical protein
VVVLPCGERSELSQINVIIVMTDAVVFNVSFETEEKVEHRAPRT